MEELELVPIIIQKSMGITCLEKYTNVSMGIVTSLIELPKRFANRRVIFR